jgi:cell division protein FtsI (penicillin-binding protein 3)
VRRGDDGTARDQRRRILVAGGMITLGVLVVAGRLFELQVLRHDPARAAWARQALRSEPVPAARGSILDRNGRLIAYDRPVLEVRAEWQAPLPSADCDGIPAEVSADLVGRLVAALAEDEERADPRQLAELRRRLTERISAGARWPARDRTVRIDGRNVVLRRTDFLIVPDLDHHRADQALQAVGTQVDRLRIYATRRHLRVHPDGQALAGVVGCFGSIELADGRTGELRTGIERLVALDAGSAGRRSLRVDVQARPYWTGDCVPATPPARVHTTLDLDLQLAADAELQAAARAVAEAYDGSGSPGPPQWGALLLVDVATGELLAMASYADGVHPRAAEFAPLRRRANPGSVIKPLMFAVALESGRLDWQQDRIDCTPNAGGRSWRVPGSTRLITDEHAFGLLSPCEVLAFSSNIGTVQIGRRLSRDEHARGLELFAIGRPADVGLPDELAPRVEGDVLRCNERMFANWLGPSYSIGYDMSLTPLQVTAAYLRLVANQRRALRLLREIELDGVRHRYDAPAHDPAPLFGPATLACLDEAFARVVSDDPHATGRALAQLLREQGIAQEGLFGGKTGTSQFDERRRRPDGGIESVVVRTASFAGFVPIGAPRYLAFCMLQKDRAVKFYGGRYAALPVGRLLLRALAREAERTDPADDSAVVDGPAPAASRDAPGVRDATAGRPRQG